MFSKSKRVILCLLLLSSFVFAQESDNDSDWFWGKVISQVQFQGLRSVKRSELAGVTDTFIGKAFTEDMYNEILDRLYGLAYFEEVEPFAKHDPKNNGKILLEFRVREHPVISSIDYKGNKKIRKNELRDTVTIKNGDVYIDSNVLVDERAIRDLYIKKGYTNVKVSHTATENDDGGMNISFNISEGENTIVSSIRFSGNSVFSERTLRGKLKLKEEGFLKNGAFQRSTLDEDKQAIINFYGSRGYIDARIIDVIQEEKFNPKKEREELTITFIIQEGSQYTFSGLKITGNEIFKTEKLLSLMKLKNGDIFNQTKYQEGLVAITNLYYENGYTSNEFSPRVNKDSESHMIGYELRIVERSRAHIENIIIKGNTKTKEDVILREIPIQSGDVFSRERIMAGLRNLYNTQYFSSVVPEPVAGSEENLVDLIFTVEEQSTTTLQFGLTFSGIDDPDDIPISLFAKWQNSNLKGTGKTVSVGTSVSSTEQGVDLTYAQNWLFNKPIQLSESLSFSHSETSRLTMNMFDGVLDDDYYYYQVNSWGTSLNSSIGRRWNPRFAIFTLTGGITNSLTDNIYDEKLYSPIDAGVNKYANRIGLKNSVYGGFSLDNRDIAYDPSKGWFLSEKASWYGLLPSIEHEFYLRNDVKLEGYLKLFDIPVAGNYWRFKTVLAGYCGLTTIHPTPGSLFGDSSKVYIDGMFNGRGWTDVYNETRGKGMLSARVELRLPIFTGILGLDGFFDAVAVKENPEQIFNDLSIEDFYMSYGPGIRFLVPQFPLHLIFANTFRIVDGEARYEDNWKFVLSFNITNR